MTFPIKNKTNIFILMGWLLLYAATPLYMYYSLISTHEAVQWVVLWDTCGYITAFCLLFMTHHYVLIPYLWQNKHRKAYVMSLAIAFALFTTYIKYNEPEFMPRPERHSMEHRRQMPKHEFPDGHKGIPHKRLPLSPPDMARMTVAILMIGADLCYAAWINDEKMRKRLMLLEQQNLRQELEHLRYQINPHFFMNTLNNIHALVDIDQDRAKRAIVELSGLMRYALYEGSESKVSLNHEMEFIRLYISLMKMRYPDKVEVTCELPENVPSEIMISPLILATFVENAFKHGVSYMQPSFINIRLIKEDGKIHFRCVNSRHPATAATDRHHGIGLENVRKRLDLQYASNYKLEINDKEEKLFSVDLILPAS